MSIELSECPFCHSGETTITKCKHTPYFVLAHRPPKGVVCPAMMEQICDTEEQGAMWWNDRSIKQGDK